MMSGQTEGTIYPALRKELPGSARYAGRVSPSTGGGFKGGTTCRS
jgi:hypothetical protein